MRSTAIVGGSQVASILLSIVRTKVLALLLGPSGVGIAGLFTSTTTLMATVFGIGIRSSGVREISQAHGEEDSERVARAATVLRRVTLGTAIGGAVLFALFSFPLSQLTFGNMSYGWAFVLLSTTLLFGQVAGGQTALIQGMRRIGDLAKLTVLGALFGTVFSIPFVYLWGTDGIAPYMVAVAAAGVIASWWYARKANVKSVPLSRRELVSEARPLIHLGAAFMATATVSTATVFLLRVIINRRLGLEGVGLYQAAWTLSSLYIGVILSAMGQDFYPRLTAAKTAESRTRLVNEQAEVGLLVAAPGVLATLVVAPFVIWVFYASGFAGAVAVLQWQILGDFLRVVSWPMSYVLVARGHARTFFLTELAGNVLGLGLGWGLMVALGLEGLGIAFFGAYLVITLGMTAVLKWRYEFHWSRSNLRLWLVVFPCVAVAFLAVKLLSTPLGEIIGGIVTVALTLFCVRELGRLLGESVVGLVLGKMRRLIPHRGGT